MSKMEGGGGQGHFCTMSKRKKFFSDAFPKCFLSRSHKFAQDLQEKKRKLHQGFLGMTRFNIIMESNNKIKD